MKNKRLFSLIVILVALGGIYLAARVTGILQSYSVPSGANHPTIKVGDLIWVSNLVSPKRNDHIVFNYYDSMMQQDQHRVYRLCGIPGDTVEIRNGDLYVNNRNTSSLFDLSLSYLLAADDGIRVIDDLKLEEDDIFVFEDKAELTLTKKQVGQLKKLQIPFERKITPKEEKDEYIARVYGRPWNIDHFGPLVIPPDRYFVLGDNRYRAQDSRYTGLVPVSDFYGTVISR